MIRSDVILSEGVIVHHPSLVNMYGCQVGPRSRIGTFVEIQQGVIIGADCKISSHSFICTGVVLGDAVFIGHGVVFTNDPYPQAVTPLGRLQGENDWQVIGVSVGQRASIGSNATIIGGVTIGEGALIGAGSVVTHDVPAFAIVVGVPARIIGDVRERCKKAAQAQA